MRRTSKTLAVALVGAVCVAFAAAPAAGGDVFCPMGGVQIKVDVVADKAVAWGEGRDKSVIAEVGSDNWSVLVLSKVDDDVAILLSNGSVFFGVAGAGGRDVGAREAEKAFGRDNRKLREVVRKEMGELWKAGAAKIDGNDVQKLADATGLGVLEKERGAWVLKTRECTGADLDASLLK